MGIRSTEPAAHDLIQICDYIEKHSGQNTARRIAILIHERVSRLSEFPEQGREGRKAGTRELIIVGMHTLQSIEFTAMI
jgi:plasmid stabilization system protein ParE